MEMQGQEVKRPKPGVPERESGEDVPNPLANCPTVTLAGRKRIFIREQRTTENAVIRTLETVPKFFNAFRRKILETATERSGCATKIDVGKPIDVAPKIEVEKPHVMGDVVPEPVQGEQECSVIRLKNAHAKGEMNSRGEGVARREALAARRAQAKLLLNQPRDDPFEEGMNLEDKSPVVLNLD